MLDFSNLSSPLRKFINKRVFVYFFIIFLLSFDFKRNICFVLKKNCQLENIYLFIFNSLLTIIWKTKLLVFQIWPRVAFLTYATCQMCVGPIVCRSQNLLDRGVIFFWRPKFWCLHISIYRTKRIKKGERHTWIACITYNAFQLDCTSSLRMCVAFPLFPSPLKKLCSRVYPPLKDVNSSKKKQPSFLFLIALTFLPPKIDYLIL